MTRVLVWIEPLPIRDRYDEFFQHGLFLAETFLLLKDHGYEASLYANTPTLQRMVETYPACADMLVWPDADENRYFESLAGPWTAERQENWADLARGDGAITARFRDIAGRILRESRAEIAITWSDNGALRASANSINIPVLHCELGPTRPPFTETFYVDPNGTNGYASFRSLAVPPSAPEAPLKSAQDLLFPNTLPAAQLGTNAHNRPEGSWVPEGPYVFIPLQLADDLNTKLHAPYATPRAFLAAVLPPLVEAGYAVVVKGHPGVSARPANVIAEDDALDLAESFGPQVSIAPREWDVDTQLACLGSCAFVCSLNSSVAFEALLLETPSILLGQAAFDIGAVLWRDPARLSDISNNLPRASQTAPLAAFLARHILHPKNTGTADLLFAELIPAALRLSATGGQINAQDWSAVIDHANVKFPRNENNDPARIDGYIEDVSFTELPDGQIQIDVKGWAFNATSDQPLRDVRLKSSDHVLACTPTKSSRPDVAKHRGLRTCSLGFSCRAIVARNRLYTTVFAVQDRMGMEQTFALRYGHLKQIPNPGQSRVPPIATRINGRNISRPVRLALLAKFWLTTRLGLLSIKGP